MNRRLYRNTAQGIVGGVLAGLADYFDQDVVLWRLGVILIFILTGFMPGLLVYLIAWVIIPSQPAGGSSRVRDAEYIVHE